MSIFLYFHLESYFYFFFSLVVLQRTKHILTGSFLSYSYFKGKKKKNPTLVRIIITNLWYCSNKKIRLALGLFKIDLESKRLCQNSKWTSNGVKFENKGSLLFPNGGSTW